MSNENENVITGDPYPLAAFFDGHPNGPFLIDAFRMRNHLMQSNLMNT